MTDPIGLGRSIRSYEQDEARAHEPGGARPREIEPAPIVPAHLDMARLARTMPVTPAAPPSAAVVGERLDAARDAFSGPYHVGGELVSAPPHFRMKGGYQDRTFFSPAPDLRSGAAFVRSLSARGREVYDILVRAGVGSAGAVMLGFGKPPALVAATQALIDAGRLPRLPAPATLADCVRQMQWDNGVGIDCVDYCMNALARVHGTSVESLGLAPGADPFGKDGFTTPVRFSPVMLRELHPGDVIALADPNPDEVGHRVIVRAHAVLGDATDPRRADLVSRWGKGAAAFLAGFGPLHVLEVDSSWGAENGQPFGGYRRDTWVFDEHSHRWLSFSPHTYARGLLISEKGPAGEICAGAYRYRP
jgi:hypothetical protein